MTARKKLESGRRVVVKIGTVLLVDQEKGTIHHAWLEALAEDVSRLRGRGQEVIIVTSGAIAVGRRHLNLPAGALRLDQNQAAAATGTVRQEDGRKEPVLVDRRAKEGCDRGQGKVAVSARDAPLVGDGHADETVAVPVLARRGLEEPCVGLRPRGAGVCAEFTLYGKEARHGQAQK